MNEPEAIHNAYGAYRKRIKGFTLAEAIIALAVISVAVTISITLYNAAATVSGNTRSTQAASALATELLTSLLNHPEAYVWQAPQTDVQVEIKAKNGEQLCSPPTSLAPNPDDSRREAALYSRCSWQAFAQLPENDAPYMELTAVIRWFAAGRFQSFTLTTLAPRSLAEGEK